jgi:hypothetical protein
VVIGLNNSTVLIATIDHVFFLGILEGTEDFQLTYLKQLPDVVKPGLYLVLSLYYLESGSTIDID